jgi:hypothetical protein
VLSPGVLVGAVKRRLHRDIVADPLLHGLVLNLYLNGERYPHRVNDYFPLAAATDAQLEAMMRRHMAEEDRHIALYTRAIQKLEQPVLELPMLDVYNDVIRSHTPAIFAISGSDDADARTMKLAHFFGHLHFLEKRIARSLEYHVEACAHAVCSYTEKAVSAVLRDEHRHVGYTRDVVRHLLPAGEAEAVLALHADAERRANLDFSARQLGRLLRDHAARFPSTRRGLYRVCTSVVRGALACA